MCVNYASEKIWFDHAIVEAAEANFYSIKYTGKAVAAQSAATLSKAAQTASKQAEKSSSLVDDVNKIRDVIKNALADDLSPADMQRLSKLENENEQLRVLISSLEKRVAALEVSGGDSSSAAVAAKSAPAPAEEEEDDDVDLFGSSDEEENEAAEKLKAERVAMYNAKKAKKATVIAKSNIIFDVKPWDDETDMVALEKSVRSVEMDGLLWGASKLVEVGYGIKKLQITCVVEDDKVGTDDLEERITAFEDYVQSMDIVAFNKI